MQAPHLGRRGLLAGGGAAALAWPLHAKAQTAGSPAGAARPQKISVALAGDALHWYPAYVARAAGLFQQEGLDVDWIDVGNGTNQAAAVLSGSATMTCTGIDHAIDANTQGGDLVAFAMLFETYPIQVTLSNAAMKRSGIDVAMPIDEKVRRLAGLTIGITAAGSGTDTMIRSLFVARKMVPDSMLHLQPVGSPPAVMAAFQKHLIDGFVLTAPYPDIVEATGAGSIAINAFTGEIPEIRDVPYTGMLTSRETIRTRPDAIMAATRALTRAITYADQHPEETQRGLHQYFKDVDPALFAKFEPVYRKAAAHSPVIRRDQYDRLLAWMNLTSTTPVGTTYQQAIVTEFAERAAADLLPHPT